MWTNNYKIRIDIDAIAGAFIGVAIFFLSYWLLRSYTSGDQAAYLKAYNLVEGLDLAWAHYLYERTISGRDAVHFLITWAYSSLGADKTAVMAIFNAGIAAYLFLLLRRWGLGIGSVMVIVLTNYYIWVVFLAAERLKFAVLFLILSMLHTDRTKWFIFFATLAAVSHVSILIIYAGIWLVAFAEFIKKTDRFAKINNALLFSVVVFVAVLLVTWPGVNPKLPTYYRELSIDSFVELFPALLLLAIAMRQYGHYWSLFLAFLPIMTGILMFGPSRLNMFAVFVFFFYSTKGSRGMNSALAILSAYLLWKTSLFLSNVLEYGHGFP